MLHPLDPRRQAAFMALIGVALLMIAFVWLTLAQFDGQAHITYAIPILILVGFVMAVLGAYRGLSDRS